MEAMINSRDLASAIHAELIPFGFKKKGVSWYLMNEEIISILNLQKSAYSDTYYLNLAFWIRSIEDVDYPKENQCHVRGRAGSLWANTNPSIAKLLYEVSDCLDCENRLTAIRGFVRERVIPLLIEGSTLAGLSNAVKNHKGLMVYVKVRELLGLEKL